MSYEREETESERLDRNWAELLQELRVTQTGTQILTGFLLTIAFQPRFTDLDRYQVALYIVLVIIAAVTTMLGLAPVSLHRRLFRKRAKDRIVLLANRILQLTLVGVAVVLTGTLALIIDVVVGRTAGVITGVASVLVVVIVWFLLPSAARRYESRHAEPTKS
jgi:threonine/homoserine/homoserine lactone efflux protein